MLGIRSFSKDDDFDPERFIEDAIRRIERARSRALIIDLRGNTGGKDSYAAHLFARIASDSFTYYARRALNKRHFQLLKGSDDWTLNYMTYFLPIARQPDGRYLMRMELDRPMRPKGALHLPVFLLLDGNSVSTSSEFGSVFKGRGRGTILGEESGSAVVGTTGATVSVVLPNTRLVLVLPLVAETIPLRVGIRMIRCAV